MSDKVHTDKKDMTISQLFEDLQSGDIIGQPDYQREYVYDNKRASLLVESVLMGIPIPVIYLSEEDDGTLEVIDGQQRIKSLTRYLNNEFKLNFEENSSFYELNGKYFKDLDKSIQRNYKKSTLSAITILKESNDLKYDIFERLNQGSVSLKPQEIRNCIYRGNLNTMLKNVVKDNFDELSQLFKNENKRMEYEENILKFLTMLGYKNIKAPFYKAMNNYMNNHKDDTEDEVEKSRQKFLSTFRLVKQVLGNNAFKNNSEENNKIRSFNGAIYDSIMVSFASFKRNDIVNNADEIRKAIEDIKENNEEYDKCIHTGTNSGVKTSKRITIIYNAIKEIVEKNSKNLYDERFFSEDIKSELYYQGCKCAVCGQEILDIKDCQVDHIIPYSIGGRTIIENAQLVHSYCNKVKSDKIQV